MTGTIKSILARSSTNPAHQIQRIKSNVSNAPEQRLHAETGMTEVHCRVNLPDLGDSALEFRTTTGKP